MRGISGQTVLDALMVQRVDQPVILLTGHGTVETHRANLFGKLQAESLAQLIRRHTSLIEAAP